MYAELLELARKVGLDAGALLMERPPAFEIESKSTAIDIATQMDKKAEKVATVYTHSNVHHNRTTFPAQPLNILSCFAVGRKISDVLVFIQVN